MTSLNDRPCRSSSALTVFLLISIVLALGACARLRAQGPGSHGPLESDRHERETSRHERHAYSADNVVVPDHSGTMRYVDEPRPYSVTPMVVTERSAPMVGMLIPIAAACVLLLLLVLRKPKATRISGKPGVAHFGCSRCGRSVDLPFDRLQAQLYCPRCGSSLRRGG